MGDEVRDASMIDVEQIDGLLNAAGVETARVVLSSFWSSTADLLASARTAIDLNDFDGLERAGHAIKGAAANVGASRISDAARLMEDAARTADAVAATAAVAEIDAAVPAVRDAFEAHFVDFRRAS
ncbi:MAG: Hpt domain-containing protein [Pseudomonadota bacterium]